jgi:predicted nucleic acid-binding protein
MDQAVALQWRRIGASRTIPPIDGLLAATALVHGLTVATRNPKVFVDLGVS